MSEAPPSLFAQWFGFRAPVSRAAYVGGGVLFMAIKFAIERAIFSRWVGRELTATAFLSPFFVRRVELLQDAPPGAAWVLVGLTLPFLSLGLSMSVRRAADARLPPLVGFLFLIPGIHYVLMFALSIAPGSNGSRRVVADPGPYRAATIDLPPPAKDVPPEQRGELRATQAILASSAVGFAMFGFCVYVLRSYGNALFLATPFAMGVVAATAYVGARRESPGYRAPRWAVGCALASLAITGIGLLFLSQEGISCIGMALVPAGALAVLGSVLALTVSSFEEIRKTGAALVMLPLAATAEGAIHRDALHLVTTTVTVDAPADVVFRNVTTFPDLDPPTEWLFRHGIAYPIRARIEGGIRYCEFSTGSFVEPITRWDAPRILAFDVAENPPPMREWSVWDHVDAPHLHGFMRSKRGEFRLTPRPDGTTVLAGSTWYELEIFPEIYWQLWSDGIVHAIHRRVLTHIKKLAEAQPRASS